MIAVMGRSDSYHRNNAKAAIELHSAGHRSTRTEGWGGGTEGVVVPLETGHQLEIGQHPDVRDGTWHFRIVRHPNDPGYEQEGLKLGAPTTPRLAEHGLGGDQDDHYGSAVVAHPRDLPRHVESFLSHPQVVNALKSDMAKMKAEKATRGEHPRPLGEQFG